MRFSPLTTTFTSLLEYLTALSPMQVLTADGATAKWPINPSSDQFHPGEEVEMIVDISGTKYRQTYRLYEHPSGAGNVSLGSMSASWVWTPSKEGLLISWDGTVPGTLEAAEDQAGILIDYFTHIPGESLSSERLEQFRVQTITAGMRLWVLCRGIVEADQSAAVTAGDFLVTSATAGELTAAAAINTAGTIAQYEDTLVENTTGYGARALAVAQAEETLLGAGLGLVNLLLPRVWR